MKETKVKYSFAEWCKDNNHQDWLDRWDYELNEIGPDDVAYRSGKKYWFKCSRGLHDGTYRCIANLTVNKNSVLICKKCNSFGQYLLDTFGEFGICQYWSDRNTIDPFDVSVGDSRTTIWIRCQNNDHPDYPTVPDVFSVMGCRCPVCVNKKIIPGINDIFTTRPDLVKYFLDANDAHKYSEMSGKRVNFKCDLCGKIQKKVIARVSTRGFHCDACSDGISYPNKFVYNFLEQLKRTKKFSFEREKVFEWSKNIDDIGTRIYDFYIDCESPVIIEAHGDQHYNGFNGSTGGYSSVEEQQYNDQLKMELALKNGIRAENYVTLNCMSSTVSWIKNSIMNSSLPQLFDFVEDDICWEDCDKFASSSLVKTVCQIWNDGEHNLHKIANIIDLHYGTVTKYLQIGQKFGWTEYGHSKNRPLLCTDNNYVFANARACVNHSEEIFGVLLSQLSVNSTARGGRPHTQGFHFTYLTRDQFKEIKNLEPHRVYE
jgi:hypothetical protein